MMAFRSPRKESFEESVQEAYLNGWNGLISGNYPRIEGGIILKNEQGLVKDDSNSSSIMDS
jgi:hypothetical protein